MRVAQFRRWSPIDYSGSESINTICSNLSFAGRDIRKVVLTSCESGDGKSYLSVQIAYNMAQRGKRVALVDCDLRKSNLTNKYGIVTNGELTGLVHYLAGINPREDVVYSTNIQNLTLVPCGRDVANPVPLLISNTFKDLLDSLAKDHDLVIVDAPPVGLVIDAAEIARNCDGVILVIKHGFTHRRDLLNAKQQLQQTGTPILGCILNDVTLEGIGSKKYYYHKYYSKYYSNYYRKNPSKE